MSWVQEIDEPPDRLPCILESVAAHARTGIERHRNAEWERILREVSEALRLVILADLKRVLVQARHCSPVLIGDDDINRHEFSVGLEC